MGEVKRYMPTGPLVALTSNRLVLTEQGCTFVKYDDYATLEAENAKLRAELERRAVPDGWKLVPVEPTHEMAMAIKAQMELSPVTWCRYRAAARAMLAAAPSAPKADDTVKVQLLEALIDLESDISERFDMTDPSTNPGIRFAVESARAAIAAARQEGKKV